MRTVVLLLLCVCIPYTSHAASQASPEWFDRVAARTLDFIRVHNACMEFLDGIRAGGRLILSAGIDGALGTKRLDFVECLCRLIPLALTDKVDYTVVIQV